MHEGNWRVALYIDDGANAGQMEELTAIFAGQKGGHFELLSSFIVEVVGVKQVPMDIVVDGKSRTLRIPGIADTSVRAIEGHAGADVIVSDTPLAIVPGSAQTVARSDGLTYRDFDFDWSHAKGSSSTVFVQRFLNVVSEVCDFFLRRQAFSLKPFLEILEDPLIWPAIRNLEEFVIKYRQLTRLEVAPVS